MAQRNRNSATALCGAAGDTDSAHDNEHGTRAARAPTGGAQARVTSQALSPRTKDRASHDAQYTPHTHIKCAPRPGPRPRPALAPKLGAETDACTHGRTYPRHQQE